MSVLNWRVLLLGVVLGLAPVAASAQSVAAIVESVTGAEGSLRMLDYVRRGQVIELGVGGRLVLGYLGSCVRETVNGGSVKIGDTQSEVVGGRVVRQTVQCDGGRLVLSKKEAEQSGVLVLRKGVDHRGRRAPRRPTRVYSITPIFLLPDGTRRISITRLDGRSKIITLPVKDGVVDLYESSHKLVAGARYEVNARSKTMVFSVHESAKLDGSGVLGRLVGF